MVADGRCGGQSSAAGSGEGASRWCGGPLGQWAAAGTAHRRGHQGPWCRPRPGPTGQGAAGGEVQDNLQQAGAGRPAWAAAEDPVQVGVGLRPGCRHVRVGLPRVRLGLPADGAELGHARLVPRVAVCPGAAVHAPGAAEPAGGPVAGCSAEGLGSMRAGAEGMGRGVLLASLG